MNIYFDTNNLAMRLLHVAAMNGKFTFDYWKYLLFDNVYGTILDVYEEFGDVTSVNLVVDSHNYWRKDIYPLYKADRAGKEFPVEGITFPEFYSVYKEFIQEMADFLPFNKMEVARCEADDVIAVMVLHTPGPHYVFSGDSDYFMLCKDDIVIQSPSAGRIEFPLSKRINNVDCFFKTREEYVQFAILTGQAGKDNVFNVKTNSDWEGARKPGFGPKAAFKVLTSGKDPLTWARENKLEENYLRNKALIDFDEIPEKVTQQILLECVVPKKTTCAAESFLQNYRWPSLHAQIELIQSNLEGIILGACVPDVVPMFQHQDAQEFEL